MCSSCLPPSGTSLSLLGTGLSLLYRFGLRPESVTGTEREKAKRTVYAIIYGIGESTYHIDTPFLFHCLGKERLGENLQISSEAAQELIKSFLSK